jgi:hypothetical protein
MNETAVNLYTTRFNIKKMHMFSREFICVFCVSAFFIDCCFITEMEFVYCPVGIEYLNKIYGFICKGLPRHFVGTVT